MRTRFPSIVKRFAGIALAGGFGIVMSGGAAHADCVTTRVVAEMAKGKDYVAAIEAANRPAGPTYSPEAARVAGIARGELMRGKDYIAANEAANRPVGSTYSPEAARVAGIVKDELMHGKDYVAATAAASASRAPGAPEAPDALRVAGTAERPLQ
jgi:hypothetical protein